MPESEQSLTVIDTNSGHGRETRNWVLGRFLRDFNDRLDEEMKDEQPHISSDASDKEKQESADDGKGDGIGKGKRKAKGQPFEGLRVTVFEVEDMPPTDHGVPTLDWVWYSGFVVIFVQLGIAAVPWGVNGQWDTFLVTAAGNLFALISSSLPQWRKEKWACPRNGGDTATITEGNGSRSAIVIRGKKGVGLKFEVLARGSRVARATLLTRIATPILGVLWILLLITVAGMKQNTWCKLCSLKIFSSLSKFNPARPFVTNTRHLRPARHWPPWQHPEPHRRRRPPLASRSRYSHQTGRDVSGSACVRDAKTGRGGVPARRHLAARCLLPWIDARLPRENRGHRILARRTGREVQGEQARCQARPFATSAAGEDKLERVGIIARLGEVSYVISFTPISTVSLIF